MKQRYLYILMALLTIAVLITGCATNAPSKSVATTQKVADTPKAPAQTEKPAEVIKFAGSKTASVVLKDVATLYTKNNPNVKFEFTVSETGAGVLAMANGSADVAMGSRDLKQSEVDAAKAAGIDAFKTTVFYDLNQFYVSKDNPINDIKSEQIKRIYFDNAGTPITDWSDISNGTFKGKIHVWGGDDALGSAGLIRDVFFKGANFTKNITRSEFTYYNVLKNESINDKYILGYTSQYYTSDEYLTLNNIKPGTYKAISVDGSYATIQNIKDGKYKVFKPVFILTKGEPKGTLKDFILFVTSPEGTKIVQKAGFTPLNN